MTWDERTIRSWSHQLLEKESAQDAIEQWRTYGSIEILQDNPGIFEALCLLLREPHTPQLGRAAADILKDCHVPVAKESLRCGLRSHSRLIRIACIKAMVHRGFEPEDRSALARCLRTDEAWTVRQEAIKAYRVIPEQERLSAFEALSDPHWRVRHDVIMLLLAWKEEEPALQERLEAWATEKTFASPAEKARVLGVMGYLSYRWAAFSEKTATIQEALRKLPEVDEPWTSMESWDEDPPVFRRNLQAMPRKEARSTLSYCPDLLAYHDEGVRHFALRSLLRWGDEETLAACLRGYDEPRQPYLSLLLDKLVQGLNMDRKEEVSRWILEREEDSVSALSWALEQVGVVFPIEPDEKDLYHQVEQCLQHRDTRIREAAYSACWRIEWLEQSQVKTFLKQARQDPAERVQLSAFQGWQARFSEAPVAEWAALDTSSTPQQLAWGAFLVKRRRFQEEEAFWQKCASAQESEIRIFCGRALSDACANGDTLGAVLEETLDKLMKDEDPFVREAALTKERAREHLENPKQETSWKVLQRAAILCKKLFATLAPQEPTTEDKRAQRVFSKESEKNEDIETSVVLETLETKEREGLVFGESENRVSFGKTGLFLSRLGISGHYGLCERGYHEALDAGVNLFFWEPDYHEQSSCFRGFSAQKKSGLYVTCGTFEAEPKGIRRDIERVLRAMKLERVGIFLIFWVRSWERLSDEVYTCLEDLKAEGKLLHYGFSTHQRALAIRAMEEREPELLMVRHNAAHRGAEDKLFPLAKEKDVGIITFNNLIYGRMLRPPHADAPEAPTAADCYRYSLKQHGVHCCFSAPSNIEQLRHNLQVMASRELSDGTEQALRRFGDEVYRENRAFADLVRTK